MKVGVISDYRINKNENVYYVNGESTLERNFTRYLSVFDEVLYMGRIVNTQPKNFTPIDSKYIKVLENEKFIDIKQYFTDYKNISKPVEKLISQVDCCIIHFPTVQGFIAARECIKQKKPWLVELCGCPRDVFKNYGNIQGKIISPIMYAITKHYVKKAPYVLYVTNEFLQARYPTNGIRGNGISNVIVPQSDEKVLYRRLDKIDKLALNSPIYIGMIGSMNVNYKGHETAIRTIRELNNFGYDVRLRCLGGGDKKRWQNLANELNIDDKIEFCGVIPSGDPIMKWIDDLDMYIMPSLTEGLPRSMIESMSRGCPSLGSFEAGGMPELLQDEFLFKAKDYKGLATKIANLINDKSKLKESAKYNYIESQKYIKPILDNKRIDFFNEFKKSVNIR